jgi:hypothetical protein
LSGVLGVIRDRSAGKDERILVQDVTDAGVVLLVIDDGKAVQRGQFQDLWDVSKALEARTDDLREFFSVARFEDLKGSLDDQVYNREKAAIRKWEKDTNKRLYGR